MISISTNIQDLILQRTLTNSTQSLNDIINRMTTGSKINNAKDNAANYSIQTSMSTQISSLLQVQQNTEDGIDMLSTAESGLSLIQNQLERLRNLAVQASSDTFDEASRIALQSEADEILEQITQIREILEYNGITLFYDAPDEEEESPAMMSMSPLSLSLSLSSVPNTSFLSLNDNSVILSSGDDDSSSDDFSFTPPTSDLPDEPTTEPISTPVMSPKSLRAPRLLGASSPITGTETFTAKQTKTLTIDGISYTVKNLQSTGSTLAYSKDTSTGEITFTCNYFDITGQVDVAHNIVINGTNNKVYGGNLDDTISEDSLSSSNSIYGKAGNDTLISKGKNTSLNGNDGNDNLSGVGTLRGDNGNDTIHQKGTGNVYGGEGDDIIIASDKSDNRKYLYGEGGDDYFYISSNDTTVNGGEGTNIVESNTGSYNILYNVVGSALMCETFSPRETKTIGINGINYTVTNNDSKDNDFIYELDSDTGQISFLGRYFTIEGELNKQHNVKISGSSNIFYGGNLADNIITTGENAIYGLDGNDTIISTGTLGYLNGGDGDDTISAGRRHAVEGGDGDDNITLNGRTSYASAGNGNDTIINNATGNSVSGGSGTNTLSGTKTPLLIEGFGIQDNAESITVAYGTTQTVTVGGKSYTIENRDSGNNPHRRNDDTVFYSYNEVTDEATFGTSSIYTISITGQDGKSHNVQLYGCNYSFKGGNQDDTIVNYATDTEVNGRGGNDIITMHAGSSADGGAGNDTITCYSTTTTYGGKGDDTIILNGASGKALPGSSNSDAGNDTYHINAENCVVQDNIGNNIYYVNTNNINVTGGNNDDTFYVEGNNNTVQGGAGNNYYIVDGDNTTVIGGNDLNYVVDNGTGTTLINAIVDPNSGILNLDAHSSGSFTIDGKTYNVTNNTALTNSLTYSYNANTGILSVNGSDFAISSSSQMNMNVRGSNNVITGSNLADNITIGSGSDNTVNGGSGNDIITMNSENNAIDGGSGSDTITLNATTNKTVTGGSDDDVLNINSDNNTNINAGAGNDTISVSGANNRVTAGAGNNGITLTGSGNAVTATTGANRLTVNSSDNIVTLGNGNNTIGVQGDNNTVTAGNALGNVNIYGNGNNISTSRGDNKVTIKGNNNTFDSSTGEKNLTVLGNGNEITTGDNNDKLTINGDNNIVESTGGNNTVSLKGNSNNYQGGSGIDDVKINGNENNAKGGDESDKFMVSSGSNNIVDGEGGNRNTIINNGTNTTFTNAVDITPHPREISIKVDTGSGDDKFIKTTISFNLFDFGVDFSTSESALESIEGIDELMGTLTSQITSIGANINRLECVAEAQSVKMENVVSSRSTLRDADIAKEASKYIRYQILQQASATLMATSRNINANSVLALIQGIGVNSRSR